MGLPLDAASAAAATDLVGAGAREQGIVVEAGRAARDHAGFRIEGAGARQHIALGVNRTEAGVERGLTGGGSSSQGGDGEGAGGEARHG
ncbi:MAG: hypothetical protein WDN45_14095 [Caulobacteraceae bacterium]